MVTEPQTRNVLVIAYYFPPMGLSGVQRTLKFVKYLPQFGWKPTVLTVTPTGYYAQDGTLLEEIAGGGVRIERAGSLDPNRLFSRKGVVRMPSERTRKLLSFMSDLAFIPDNKIGWKKRAVGLASELLRDEKFSVIFATAPPFTGLLAGLELKEKFKVPLVVDYRDAWLDYPGKRFPTPYHRWRNAALERNVLRGASAIITTNRRVKELILKRHKFLEYRDIRILPQGYDPADFAGAGAGHRPLNGTMKVTHAGVFYGRRNPRRLLEAVALLRERRPDVFSSLRLNFVGVLQDEYAGLVKRMGLEEKVTITGYLDHANCVAEMVSSDVLWFTLDNDTQSPGKLYEYLAARRPILACVGEGFVRQTLAETGGAIVRDPDDVEGIASALGELLERHRANNPPLPDESEVRKFDRVMITNELSKIFGFLAE